MFKRIARVKPLAVVCLVFLFAGSAFAVDVPEVKNGRTVTGSAVTLNLEENLRLTPDMGDEYIWAHMAVAVDTDSQGNIYVGDPGEQRIVMFDPDGKFVKFIGGKGQGPGEFMAMAAFRVTNDDHVYAYQGGPTGGYSIFKDGEYVEKTNVNSMAMLFQTAHLSPDASKVYAMAIKVDGAAGKLGFSHIIYDMNTKIQHPMESYQTSMPGPDMMSSPDKFTDFLAENMKSAAKGLLGYADFSADGKTYTAKARFYEVTVHDKEMNPVLKFGREYKPIPQTDQDIKDAVEPLIETMQASVPPQMKQMFTKNVFNTAIDRAGFGPVRFPVNGLRIMEDGHILVVHDVDLGDNMLKLDIFDQKGKYVGNADLPLSVTNVMAGAFNAVFRNGHMYRIEENEDGENELVRYKASIGPK